jgi:teichuronic acid biosynthesis glycosyltransferase TuaC
MHVLAVTNMYPTPHSPTAGTFIEQQIQGLRAMGVRVDILLVDRPREGMRAYLKLRGQIRQTMALVQPQIIHVMYGGVTADVVTRAVSDRPTVVSFCGSDLLGEHLSGYLRKLISSYGVLASRRAARRATGVIVKSKNLKEALPRDVDQFKVRIIPNGVNLERFRPLDRDLCHRQLGWDARRFHVLFPVNSGDPRKRPALARAAVEGVKRLGIQAELHQLQKVPHHEVPVWLNASDVVLLTSLHEGSPNIVKEALACNVPIVSVDVGDVRERIEQVEGCYLALPQSDDLAAKLHSVYARSCRVAGREKVQELSLQRIAVRLREFYSDLLNSRPFGPRPVSP